jgi:MFS family permease
MSSFWESAKKSNAWRQLATLRRSPREMWITQVVARVLLSFGYFTLLSIFVPFVAFEYGLTDQQSMRLFGVWGACKSFYQLLVGPLIDYFGVRKSLVFGSLLFVIGLSMFALAFEIGVMFVLAIFFFLPAGISLGLPVCEVGSKQYSYAENNSIVYNIGYSVSNLGGGLGSLALYFLVLEFRTAARAMATQALSLATTTLGAVTSTLTTMPTTTDPTFKVSLDQRQVYGNSTGATTTMWTTSFVFDNTTTGDNMQEIVSLNSGGQSDWIEFNNRLFSPQRVMLFVFALAAAVAGLIAALTIGDIVVNRNGDIVKKLAPQDQDLAVQNAAAEGELIHDRRSNETEIRRIVARDRWNILDAWFRFRSWIRNDLRALLTNRGFWRLSLFVLISLGARHVFQQLNTTLPLYLYRVQGPEAPVNLILSINFIGITVFVPLMALVTPFFDMYHCIIFGSFISSGALLILAHSEPTVAAISFAMFLFTVGESIYSPLIARYILCLAPDEKTGQYSSLTSAPIFLGQVLVAFISGDLLDSKCPRGGDGSECGNVWDWIAAVSFVTPIAYILLYRVIHTPEVRLQLSMLRLAGRVGSLASQQDGVTAGDVRVDDKHTYSSQESTVYRVPALTETPTESANK